MQIIFPSADGKGKYSHLKQENGVEEVSKEFKDSWCVAMGTKLICAGDEREHIGSLDSASAGTFADPST